MCVTYLIIHSGLAVSGLAVASVAVSGGITSIAETISVIVDSVSSTLSGTTIAGSTSVSASISSAAGSPTIAEILTVTEAVTVSFLVYASITVGIIKVGKSVLVLVDPHHFDRVTRRVVNEVSRPVVDGLVCTGTCSGDGHDGSKDDESVHGGHFDVGVKYRMKTFKTYLLFILARFVGALLQGYEGQTLSKGVTYGVGLEGNHVGRCVSVVNGQQRSCMIYLCIWH